jgi:hypothetical protein
MSPVLHDRCERIAAIAINRAKARGPGEAPGSAWT